MSNLEITFRLPEALIERARALGIDVEAQTEPIIAALEKEIRRKEAERSLLDFMDKIDDLPDELKLTQEEIDAEIRAYRAEKKPLANHQSS